MFHHPRYGDVDETFDEHQYGCEVCRDQGCGTCTDLAAQARDDELGAEFGDPRRCPRHGTQTSDAFGLFDAPCGDCEAESDLAAELWEYDASNDRRRFCELPAPVGRPRRPTTCLDVDDGICF